MESIINHYYHLVPENLKKRYGGFLFYVEEERYLLVEVLNETELLKIYQILINHHIGNFIIINNIEGNQISKQDDKNYLLFKIRCNENENMTLKETINIHISGSNIWSKVWGERINYYEIQINELAQDKKVVLDSINYYIGLAENAITIANKYEKELNEHDYAIQHYRMYVPVKKGDYFNPNNMLIDISIRDIAEYIKSSFFNNPKDNNDYLEFILSLPLDQKKANFLLARLLYPSYYFDLFDEIILEERDEHDLIPVIKESKEYELFLKELYEKLTIKYQMIYIEWLKKGTKVPHQ